MNIHQSEIRYYLGHLMEPEGGLTVQAELTDQCLEADSDKVKLPGEVPSIHRGTSIISEANVLDLLTNAARDQVQNGQQGVSKDRQSIQNKGLSIEQLTMLRLKAERETLWKSLGKKQGYKIASLNMKGRRNSKREPKWAPLTTMMRKQRLLVLAVQETHLDLEEASLLALKYPKIIVESNGHSKSKGGVAFVINKDLIGDALWHHTELIPGRMSRLQIITKDENGLDLINLYAPNNDKEKAEFFGQVHEIMTGLEDLADPIILGDFNFVEEPMDRIPAHEDDKKVVESFKLTKKKLKLYDGWREHNPTAKKFSFHQNTPGRKAPVHGEGLREG
ncbi:hypothetical protein K443DRAFT_125470 [Laccaria amethystina LaAM-08-1]|uniref:Endonuclease/exonuclease/phosphatase domain-containing protein n=1 Tax=Laccaria amethystina LaAM-08-1 TaxID=1095629 RepID=A0A0C9WXY0_9AGAR|nr:hypothetical protein K443DRAFT_125470 [Laccaria amethystina LaAM-08-1]